MANMHERNELTYFDEWFLGGVAGVVYSFSNVE
jgi:hypothetical protein